MLPSIGICRPIIEKLGKDRMSKIKVIGKFEAEQSFYGQLVLGKGVSSSLDEQLVREARKAGRFLTLNCFCMHIFKSINIFIQKLWLWGSALWLLFGPASNEKQKVAKEVASMLKLSVDVDTSSSERWVYLRSVFCVFCFLSLICYMTQKTKKDLRYTHGCRQICWTVLIFFSKIFY